RRPRPAFHHRGSVARRDVRAALAPRRLQVRDHEGDDLEGSQADARDGGWHGLVRLRRRDRRRISLSYRRYAGERLAASLAVLFLAASLAYLFVHVVGPGQATPRFEPGNQEDV